MSDVQIPEDVRECYDACLAAEKAGCGEDCVDAATEILLIERIAALTTERDEYRAAFEKEVDNFESMHRQRKALEAEVAALREQVARLSAPVSDAEWLMLCAGDEVQMAEWVQKRDVDNLIAARKEQPHE